MNLKEKIVTAPPWIQTEREQYLEKQERRLLKFTVVFILVGMSYLYLETRVIIKI